ncbi:uncharacterized protein LOC144441151 [Glandiceps talaboti]
MSRHLEGFQMYETRTAEDARRRNRFAENQKNNELDTQKELERLHIETMKKERRRLENELSKIRNKGQYMVKRPSNMSNQAVNFTLRHSGPMYGSKNNPALSSTWHGNPNHAKATGASSKRKTSRAGVSDPTYRSERRASRRKVSNITQPMNGSHPGEKTSTPEQKQDETTSNGSAVTSDVTSDSPISRVKEANTTPRVHRSSIIIVSGDDTPRRPSRKSLSIFDLDMNEARDSVAKRLLSDEAKSDSPVSSPRSSSPRSVPSAPARELSMVPEEPTSKPSVIPPISGTLQPTDTVAVSKDVKEESTGEKKGEEALKTVTEEQKADDESGVTGSANEPTPESENQVANPESEEKDESGPRSGTPTKRKTSKEEDSEITAEDRAQDLRRMQQMLENPNQMFDQGKYAPDGGLRTIHLLPDSDEAFEEAKKARYLRGKDWAGTETELSINEIFGKESSDDKENETGGQFDGSQTI